MSDQEYVRSIIPNACCSLQCSTCADETWEGPTLWDYRVMNGETPLSDFAMTRDLAWKSAKEWLSKVYLPYTDSMFETPYWPSKLTKYSIARLQGANMSQAARGAGYSPALQNQAGNRIEPKAQASIREALLFKGVGTERLAEIIDKGLNATKPVKDFGIVDDFKERREYARLSLEALGELKTGNTVAVQINLPSGLAEFLAEDAGEYKPE